ncbi:LSU ribosomal protein L10P [Stanieria cyanosphaera PCC 7437]|uniref:Large ribosomal subunit protein uL10 n=1 Tax=Stanieria cyanosphaera (strain ATCC 29371 / PCC 7437) TaxID=111780 RepID=K9XTA0_STAC7|nr:50S ribosomal protein L10 [Stanieria cyanosphaera]AFZ35306.1 LSU ribosomal protein L10P [Stanieria cyanosphaera PCC 7437]
MGRTLANKQEIVTELKEILKESQMAFVIDYEGLSVAEITDLRNRLRPAGATCKITKNTLMNIAIEGDENWQPMQQFLSNASAFLLAGEEVGAAVKAYKEFQKATKKTELRGGVMEGQALTKEQVEALGDLPSKEELYAQIAGALNALATKIAVGVKEVPASLARGIKAVSEKEDQAAA